MRFALRAYLWVGAHHLLRAVPVVDVDVDDGDAPDRVAALAEGVQGADGRRVQQGRGCLGGWGGWYWGLVGWEGERANQSINQLTNQ